MFVLKLLKIDFSQIKTCNKKADTLFVCHSDFNYFVCLSNLNQLCYKK